MIRISVPTTLIFKAWAKIFNIELLKAFMVNYHGQRSTSARFKFLRSSHSRPLASQSGFTLIELLVVIGLIALIMSIGVPNFGLAIKMNITNSSRELATTIRTAHDEAVLKGIVYRIALDLDKKEYWVEAGDKDFLMRTEAQAEEERRKNDRRSDEEKEKFKESFALAKSITKKKKELPRGVKFEDVITARSKDPVTTGIVYAHIFPHGFTEKITIHIKDDFDRQNTLIVNSVTGKSRVFERYVKESEQ